MNRLGTCSSDTRSSRRSSVLASISRNIEGASAWIRRVIDSPAFHEAYLSHAVALGKGDVTEIVVRVAMNSVTQTFQRAFNKKHAWARAAMQQAT